MGSVSAMGDCVLASLRGKVLAAPEKQKWRLQYHDDGAEYAYTYEAKTTDWTPMNSNLHMQGIKVKVHNPVPETVSGGSSTESTLMLLELIKEKKKQENKVKKDEMIRKMALELKKKKKQREGSIGL